MTESQSSGRLFLMSELTSSAARNNNGAFTGRIGNDCSDGL